MAPPYPARGLLSHDGEGYRTVNRKRGYPTWAWILGALTLFPLVPMLIGRNFPSTRRYLGGLGVSLSSIGLLVVLVVVIGVATSTGGGNGEPTAKRERPAPIAKPVDMTVSAETREIVLVTIGSNPGVLDAAISQEGENISLVIVVGAATSEQYARQLGENFVRQFKSMSQDDSPGKDVGTGMFNYTVQVVGMPGEKVIAQGAKVSFSNKISW